MTTSYKIDPTGTNSFDSVTLDSLNSFTINEQGESATLGSDGKPYINLITTSNIFYEVTVEGKDVGINIAIGREGSLVLRAAEQENGSGVTATKKVFTFAQTVLTGTDRTVNHSGESVKSWTFQCASDDGTTSPLLIT